MVEEMRAMLVAILQERPRRWWTSYSLWFRILETNADLARRIEDRYGPAVGRGGGAKTGPVHGISSILGDGRTPHVMTERLQSEDMVIGGWEVSGPHTAIFRWST